MSGCHTARDESQDYEWLGLVGAPTAAGLAVGRCAALGMSQMIESPAAVTITRHGQILEVAVGYELIEANLAKVADDA
jgi:hypothetical protein